MSTTSRQKSVLANPFFAALLVVSTLFVATVLAWLVAARELDNPERPVAKAAQLAFASWLDRNGPLIMGIEFTLMLLTGVTAMATDDWFAGKSKSPGSPRREQQPKMQPRG
jgi:hypothetical protein